MMYEHVWQAYRELTARCCREVLIKYANVDWGTFDSKCVWIWAKKINRGIPSPEIVCMKTPQWL